MLSTGRTVSSPLSSSSGIRVKRRAASMLEYSAPCTPAVTRSLGPGERPRRIVQGIESPGSGSTNPDQRSWPALAGTLSGMTASSGLLSVVVTTAAADDDPARPVVGVPPNADVVAAHDVASLLNGRRADRRATEGRLISGRHRLDAGGQRRPNRQSGNGRHEPVAHHRLRLLIHRKSDRTGVRFGISAYRRETVCTERLSARNKDLRGKRPAAGKSSAGLLLASDRLAVSGGRHRCRDRLPSAPRRQAN